MARLFISYRRKDIDNGVAYLRDCLKEHHYAIWFDTESIRLGDPDWQQSIERGIESSDAVILFFSPNVLESEPIKHEIRTAQSKNKRIFIVVIEPFPPTIFPSQQDLLAMGLVERYQVMDFTKPEERDMKVNKLVEDLYAWDIRPSPQQIRQHTQQNLNEQKYLRRLIEDMGTVRLNKVMPYYEGDDPLIEDLYTPVQTDLRLVYPIEKYDIDPQQCWLCRSDLYDTPGIVYHPLKEAERSTLKQAHAAFISGKQWNLDLIDIFVEKRRAELATEKQESHHRRMARLDNAYEVVALDPVQVAAIGQRTLLIGEAGTGKTTFFHYLSTYLAGQLLPDMHRFQHHPKLDAWIHGDMTPVYIDMRLLWEMGYLSDQGEWKVDAIERYIQEQVLKGNESYWSDLQRDLNSGYALLILDGLERVLSAPGAQLKNRQKNFNTLLEALSATNRVLMSGRPEYFTTWQPANTAVARITGLAPEHCMKLAAQIYYSDSRVETTEDTLPQLAGFLSQFAPELQRNPRFVTMLSTVYPAKRGVLYHHMIDLLLDNWTKPSPGMPSIMEVFKKTEMIVDQDTDKAEAKITEVLGRVVAELIEEYPDRKPVGKLLRRLVIEHLGEMGAFYGLNPEDARIYLSENAGVLVGSDENFRFAHEDFRYYFLATHLLDEIQNIGSQPEIPLVRQRIQDSPDVWAEPIQMICDMVVENDKGNIQRVRGLLEDLLGEYEPGEPEAPEPAFHTDAVVLAARIAIAQEITSKHDRRLIKQLVQWLAALLQTTNDLKQRAELGRMLGALGDPRPGIDLPSMQWVDVPAGSALVGGYHADDPYKTDDDSKRTLIELPGFQIGRYPVTVAQYEAFVNDGGYQQDEYWVEGEDRSGLIWRQDRQHPTIGWHDPLWHIPNHPVIGVTWYEASAFCRWFSAKTGTPVSLPTVAQWIWAARGDSDRIFPYGNTFDPARGNSYLSGIGRTTAVGLFARNGEPTDLSGNVYEWCQDAVPEKRLDDKRVLHYILMGGSWSSYPGFCRIDARYKDNPAFATPYWGFRIVK